MAGDVLWAPARAFRNLSERPKWFVPYVGVALTSSVLGVTSFIKLAPSIMERMPAQPGVTSPAAMYTFSMVAAVAGSLVSPLVTGLVRAGLLSLLANLTQGTASFRTHLSVVFWAMVPMMIGSLIKTLFVLAAPAERVGSISLGPAVLLPNLPYTSSLFTVLDSLNVFAVWSWVLLVIGYSVVNGKDSKRSAWVGAALYGVSLVLALAMASLGRAISPQ
jgi:hypothetical protein